MNKLVVAFCLIIIVKHSVNIKANEEEVSGRDNSALILNTTALISDILKAVSIKSDENATTKDKADILSRIVKEAGIMAFLMTRSIRLQKEFLTKLHEFFASEKGHQYLQDLKESICVIEQQQAT